MRKLVVALSFLALIGAAPAAPAPTLDRTILHAQVILDHLGFSPGIIDGREGISLKAALRGFQEANNVAETGKLDTTTLRALYPHRNIRPAAQVTLTREMLAGPFINPTPHDYALQAKMPALAYRSPLEKLAEMFHTSPKVLVELNSAETVMRPGAKIVVPNVLPSSSAYPSDMDAAWRQTLAALNVDATQPQGEKIIVDKSEGVLKVFDGEDRLVAQFSATMGSSHDPLPIGKWKVVVIDRNPKFHYNPDLFWDADSTDKAAMLPPGPNGPVGVVWIDINKPHYGIHGTPEPQTIGRTESHGCIRLTNWDAARLSMMVKPGTPAIFQP